MRRSLLCPLIIAALLAIVFHPPAAALAQQGSIARSAANGVPVDLNERRETSPRGIFPAGPPALRAVETSSPAAPARPAAMPVDIDQMLSPQGMTGTLKIMALLTVLSLAPSALIMTTCFIRFVVVLGLLRQALGTGQSPPNQVIVSLCLFLTVLVMAPVWQEGYEAGVRPYADPAPGQAVPSLSVAFGNATRPLRRFMAEQIERTGNSDAVWLFLSYQQPTAGDPPPQPETYDDVPLSVLIPAYMLSELKTAFVIGFQVYLPFLVIDFVVSTILLSMGMMMLPPVLISLPFKLLLFVLIDGWFLTVGMLLESVRPLG